MKKKITLLLLMLVSIVSAQVTNEGKPMSWQAKSIERIEAYKLPQFDLSKLQAEDKITDQDKNKPWRYGYEFLVDHNLNNSGNWTTLSNGDRIWRIRYSSEGAQTLNFLFSDYYMPEGAKVYLYNNDRTDLLGAYDAEQNNEKRELGTWLVAGSDIWIEYYEPAAVKGHGKLEIFKVVHGYRSLKTLGKSPDEGLNTSNNCHYDVNCFMEDIDGIKDVNKKAVALIIVANSAFCTGALVNNTSNNGTPYLLTADHCVGTQDVSQWSFRFNWISTNPVCSGNKPSESNTNYYQTVSGAALKARNAATDFALVEITANLPKAWDLVWAGWDRSETPAQSTFGIHHPARDIMKASRDFDAPVLTNFMGAFVWQITKWDLGDVEAGSSGSPLFNQDGRIVGQLLGGESKCNGNEAIGSNYYGRFSKSWDAGSTSSTRLKEWLDPTSTGVMSVNHYPAQSSAYAVNARVSIIEVDVEDCGDNTESIIRLINKGTENLTSAQINYSFNGAPVVINWTGNLAVDEADDIELPDFAGVSGENNLTVNVLLPNGVADEDPSDNTAYSDFTIAVFPVTNIVFSLETDKYGEDVVWGLQNEKGDFLYVGDNYGAFATDTKTFNLTQGGCYTFTIGDRGGDGLCCLHGDGFYSLTTASGVLIHRGDSYTNLEQVTFRLTGVASTDDVAFKSAIKVYPNPSSGIFNVVSENNLDYKVSNMLGQVIKIGNLNQSGNIDISSNASGIYMLTVKDIATGKTANYKLVKE